MNFLKETFRLQSGFQLIKGELQSSNAYRLHELHDQLKLATGRVNGE